MKSNFVEVAIHRTLPPGSPCWNPTSGAPPVFRVSYSAKDAEGEFWILFGTRLWPRIQEARESQLLDSWAFIMHVDLKDRELGPWTSTDHRENVVLGAMLAGLDRAARKVPITGGGSCLPSI